MVAALVVCPHVARIRSTTVTPWMPFGARMGHVTALLQLRFQSRTPLVARKGPLGSFAEVVAECAVLCPVCRTRVWLRDDRGGMHNVGSVIESTVDQVIKDAFR
jgi:hypothetical protein